MYESAVSIPSVSHNGGHSVQGYGNGYGKNWDFGLELQYNTKYNTISYHMG